ncbi:MAG: 3-dehydroquinate synthase [Chloracidobacterium sp.]|nr:3-dehydroquinate synthase [Chloracidobacterium sp.]
MKHSLKIDFQQEASAYEIVIGSDLLSTSGKWTRKCLGRDAAKIVIISNPTVFDLYGKQVEQCLRASGFVVSHFLMRDGEQFKNLRTVESALIFFAEQQLSRTDAVVALGGGVVGDLAGFASAVYLRGIAYLHIPTTMLSMIDSSVGGKTGVNSASGKNQIGAFHQPKGVLIDTVTLQTLPPRELTAGFCEAVKQAAISGQKLFKQNADFLSAFPPEDFDGLFEDENFRSEISDLIVNQIAFKAEIVAGDERESSNRTDKRSRKVLNFGHTLAHALEKVTDYKYLKHGEAVGYGVMFAAELSKSLALCGEKDVKLLNDVVHRAGMMPRLTNIDEREVFEAFKFDKKHLSGSLQMLLLKGIGKPVIVSENDIPRSLILKVLKSFLQKWS